MAPTHSRTCRQATTPIDVDPTSLPADYSVVTSPGPISLPVGGASTGNDVGINNHGSIGDRIWIDADNDGVQDPAESNLVTLAPDGPVAVNLLQGGVVVDTVTTTDGTYRFDDLLAGDYTVQVDEATLPAGFSLTTANDVATTLGVGGDDDSIDFGANNQGAINGTVWHDIDASQAQDANEPGLGGVSVDLVDDGGNVIATVTTNPDGSYTFGNVNAGDYTVHVDETTLPAAATPTTTNPVPVSLAIGETVNDVDVGANGPGTVGDTVFVDADGDGTQAGTLETGRPNVTVILPRRRRERNHARHDRRERQLLLHGTLRWRLHRRDRPGPDRFRTHDRRFRHHPVCRHARRHRTRCSGGHRRHRHQQPVFAERHAVGRCRLLGNHRADGDVRARRSDRRTARRRRQRDRLRVHASRRHLPIRRRRRRRLHGPARHDRSGRRPSRLRRRRCRA